MKTVNKSISRYTVIILFFTFSFSSCVDYLDKAPEVAITSEEVFSSFPKFQGFVEDIYQCMRHVTSGGQWSEASWNFGGDEALFSTTGTLAYQFETGNYWWWNSSADMSIFTRVEGTTPQPGNKGQGVWQSGWTAIRKCNMAIENIDKLEGATEQERNIILGQVYFFRAYFHFDIVRAWGHISYIDEVFAPDALIRPETQTYKYVADRIEEDLLKAIPLLPVDWDEPGFQPGEATKGMNKGRVTKGAAYSYLALNRLYAASALMNGEETGSFTYNKEICGKAAEAYLEVIKLADQGVYELLPWANYSKNFYTTVNTERPLMSKEIIWGHTNWDDGVTQMTWQYGDHAISNTPESGWGRYLSPTENYVRNFGMANGLPLDEPDSGWGWDTNDPFSNRDPRFYYNIICDGDIMVFNNPEHIDHLYQFYTSPGNGLHRKSGGSLSGYGYRKYHGDGFNNVDNRKGYYIFECPKVRLAGIYLEYAESANEAYGPNGGVPGGLTAVQAVNIVRARAGVPPVDSRFLVSTEKFREIIWQERAVELAFEGHRWYDLRRWYVADQMKYREKYALYMDKDHTSFEQRVYATTVFEPKHWWLPFLQKEHVSISPVFKQNPGW